MPQHQLTPPRATDGLPRPFTNMIDKLIAEEKRKTPKRPDPRDRPPGIGPLSEPVMSSTQRSDLSEEFRPLPSDSSPWSSEASVPTRVAFQAKDSNPANVESLDDEDYVNYLKTLDQGERKRHLVHQREALMAEQQRLQAILSEQEGLLMAKQGQLHQQQVLQRRRLAYFESTGQFPPPEWDGTVPPRPASVSDWQRK